MTTVSVAGPLSVGCDDRFATEASAAAARLHLHTPLIRPYPRRSINAATDDDNNDANDNQSDDENIHKPMMNPLSCVSLL